MAHVLEYQPVHHPTRQILARIVIWSGTLLAVIGTAALVVAVAANLQYYNSYPRLDIILFVLGVLATPLIGLLLLICGLFIRRGSRAAALVVVGILLLACALCLGVMAAAAIEALECFRRGALIDGMITLGGGFAFMGALAFLALWLARRIYPVNRPGA